jgi:hypothetical protein
MLAPQGKTVVFALHVSQAVTRSPWETLRATYALQTLVQRPEVIGWSIALAFVVLQDQMELAACRVQQAAIRIQRAMQHVLNAQPAHTRLWLHHLRAPTVHRTQFLHMAASFEQTACVMKGTVDLTEACALRVREESLNTLSETPHALNVLVARPRRKAATMLQIASAPLDTRAPMECPVVFAERELSNLIPEMQLAQNAGLALSRT